MIYILVAALAVWIYILTVLYRAKLTFFQFLVGSVGLFIFIMVILQPLLTEPLSRAVAAATGVLGNLTGMYQSYYQYALIFIDHNGQSISLYIDYECSGVIELLAFTSLVWFFPLYKWFEKLLVSVIGIGSVLKFRTV